jgi:hypothetical protein
VGDEVRVEVLGGSRDDVEGALKGCRIEANIGAAGVLSNWNGSESHLIPGSKDGGVLVKERLKVGGGVEGAGPGISRDEAKVGEER